MNGRQIHRRASLVLAAVMLAVGVVLLLQSASSSQGGVLGRVVLGVMFLLVGVGRIYLEMRRGRRR